MKQTILYLEKINADIQCLNATLKFSLINLALLLYQKAKNFEQKFFKGSQVLHNFFHKRPGIFFFLMLLYIFLEDLNTEYPGKIRHCTYNLPVQITRKK